jgi:HlyD family secretion protein/epimerase transport system membrane fusion protein
MIATALTAYARVELACARMIERLPAFMLRAEEAFLGATQSEVKGAEALIRARFETIEEATFGPRRFGYAIVIAFFVIGGLWAAAAPLSSAAIAPGIVSPKSSRQTVQHLEGGIIRDILVHEGDQVKAGETLITLEDVTARSEVRALRNRYQQLVATAARLMAERDGASGVNFPQELMKDINDPAVREIIDSQVNQFNTRHANDESRKAILRQKVAELEKQIDGLQQQVTSSERQSALIAEEQSSVETLVNKGLERKPRLLQLQRNTAELLGQQGDLNAKIAQAHESIGEAQLEIMKTDIQRAEEVDADLAETQNKAVETGQMLHEREDRLARTAIAAPVTGTILDIRFKTAGGVIKAGDDVLDIVPTEDALVIDTRVSPKDIDQVRMGLKATVTFPSYLQRTQPRIEGKVTQVSADTLSDQRTGEHYYTARVEVDRHKLHDVAPNIELQPGMPAEVFIATGERTMLEYLLGPFFNVLRKSFRES